MEATKATKAIWYTASPGGYDRLHPLAVDLTNGKMVAGRDAVIEARRQKILGWMQFERSLWMDANIHPRTPQSLLEFYESLDSDLVFLEHPQGDGLRNEAARVMNLNKDSKHIVNDQMARYEREGMNMGAKVYATGAIFRRRTQAVKDFCRLWFEEIKKGSIRDQLSLPYVLWNTGIEFRTIHWDVVMTQVKMNRHQKKWTL